MSLFSHYHPFKYLIYSFVYLSVSPTLSCIILPYALLRSSRSYWYVEFWLPQLTSSGAGCHLFVLRELTMTPLGKCGGEGYGKLSPKIRNPPPLPPWFSMEVPFPFWETVSYTLELQTFCWPSSVQFSSVTQLCPTLYDPMNCSTPGLPVCHHLPESTQMSIESVMPSNHPILCCPLLLLPSIFPSIRVFSNESALRIRWPKYWSFSFNISPSNEHPGLISFRMDWLDLLAVQGTSRVFSHTTVPNI